MCFAFTIHNYRTGIMLLVFKAFWQAWVAFFLKMSSINTSPPKRFIRSHEMPTHQAKTSKQFILSLHYVARDSGGHYNHLSDHDIACLSFNIYWVSTLEKNSRFLSILFIDLIIISTFSCTAPLHSIQWTNSFILEADLTISETVNNFTT